MDDDIYVATEPFVQVLESLGVSYYIGGSVASSTHGLPRTTLDIDLVANIKPHHVESIVHALESRYFVDGEMIKEALEKRSSFNIIHLETMFKLDVFLPTSSYDEAALRRATKRHLGEGEELSTMLSSAEDVILHKLYWFRLGDETSERQWNDVLGVLKVQGETLDRVYLEKWSADLGVADLLEQALEEADLKGDKI